MASTPPRRVGRASTRVALLFVLVSLWPAGTADPEAALSGSSLLAKLMRTKPSSAAERFWAHPACQDCTPADVSLVRRWQRDGLVIARSFLDEQVLSDLQAAFEEIVAEHATKLEAEGKLSHPASDYISPRGGGSKLSSAATPMNATTSSVRGGGKYSFDEVYAAMYRDNLEHNGGASSDLPAYFRREAHRDEIYRLLMHERLQRVILCMLQAEALRLYPVYMMRGKVPDKLSGGSMTVDWHQDAEYTYYWYSNLNTTLAEMDRYAASIVNTWVAVSDVPLELGPVQLMHHSGRHLARADMLCKGCASQPANSKADSGALHKVTGRHAPSPPPPERLSGAEHPAVEYLRVHDIDRLAGERPELLETATMKRGDVIFFNQYVYHRGVPNTSPNKTRWSLDFRFQRAEEKTLRGEKGFVLGTPSQHGGRAGAVPSGVAYDSERYVGSAADWRGEIPSLRLSELRRQTGNTALGGNDWGRQHSLANSLPGAFDLKLDLKTQKKHQNRNGNHDELQ